MEALSTKSLSVRQRLAELSKIDPNACFSQDQIERRRDKIIRNSMILPMQLYKGEIKPFQNFGSLIQQHSPLDRPIFLLKTDFFRNIHPQTVEERLSSIKEPSDMCEEVPANEAIDVQEEIIGIKRAKNVETFEQQGKLVAPTPAFSLEVVKATEPQSAKKISEEPVATQTSTIQPNTLNFSQTSPNMFNNNLTTNIFNQPANSSTKPLFNITATNNSFLNSKSESNASLFSNNNNSSQQNLFTIGSAEQKKLIIESTSSMNAFKVPEVKAKIPNLFTIGTAKTQDKIEIKQNLGPIIFTQQPSEKINKPIQIKQQITPQLSIFQGAQMSQPFSEQSNVFDQQKRGNIFQKDNAFAAPPATNNSIFSTPSLFPSISVSPIGNSALFGSKDNLKETQQTVSESIKSSPFARIGGFPKKEIEVQPPSPFVKTQANKVSNTIGGISFFSQNQNQNLTQTQTSSLSGFGQSNTLSTPLFGFAPAPKTTPETSSTPIFQNQSKSPFDKQASKPLSFASNSSSLLQNSSTLQQPSLFMNATLATTNQLNSTPFNFGSKETAKSLPLQSLFGSTENKPQQLPLKEQTSLNQSSLTVPITKPEQMKITPKFKPIQNKSAPSQYKLTNSKELPQSLQSEISSPQDNSEKDQSKAKSPQNKEEVAQVSVSTGLFGSIPSIKQNSFLSKPIAPEEPSKKGFIFPSHTSPAHTPKFESSQSSLFGSLKQESGNSIAIGPGGTKIEVLSFLPKTESSNLFGPSKGSSPFQSGTPNIFQQKIETQNSGGNLFTMGESLKEGDLFSKNNMFNNQKLFSSAGPNSGMTGGGLFTQQGSSILDPKNLTYNDKGQGEDDQDDEDDEPIEAQDEANPQLSTGSYDYIQTQVFFKENANKYRLGAKQTIQNVIVSLQKFTDKPDRYLYVRMSNKCIAFTGKILPIATQVRSINNSTKNIEIKKILLIDEKTPDKLELVMLKLQFKDESTGGKLLKELEKCLAATETK